MNVFGFYFRVLIDENRMHPHKSKHRLSNECLHHWLAIHRLWHALLPKLCDTLSTLAFRGGIPEEGIEPRAPMAPSMDPASWASMYSTPRSHGIEPCAMKPTVTAGFTCPPDTLAKLKMSATKSIPSARPMSNGSADVRTKRLLCAALQATETEQVRRIWMAAR